MTQHPPEGDFLASGTVLRDCEIESIVGRGGFGVVYKGRHRMLQTDVAIKEYFPRELAQRRSGVVQPTESGFEESFEDGLQRFIAEGRRLQSIQDHPNIVSCRDLFRANGTAYMVMDFVDGLPLSALLELRERSEEPFTEEDLLRVILPLLNGLKRAHETGLYHRDIKPSNILIRRKDNQPVLIDFGAAKQETSGVTNSMAPYTDGYAAMEQIGEGAIGPWTDIYGVGAVMWRMVAGGNPPWMPPSPARVQQRAYAELQDEADPLPSASVVGLGRFSPSLLLSIDQCLEISASSRVRSCGELVAKLLERTVASVQPPAALKASVEKSSSRPRSAMRALPNRSAVFYVGVTVLILLSVVLVARIAEGPAADGIKEAAEQGDAEAQHNLGLMHAEGRGVPQDDGEAVQWYRKAAEQGLAEAQVKLGAMYATGRGVPQDDGEAVQWYRKAAEQGLAKAQSHLGFMYAVGRGVPQDDGEAVQWYRKAAEQGLAKAQSHLGFMYAVGRGVPQDDGEAAQWYRQAAEQGDAEAQFSLGVMYAVGRGVPQDDGEAAQWYRQAAEQGDAKAQFNLGFMYAKGRGVPQDDGEAVQWYRKAAEQGLAEAQSKLGTMYGIGRGVPQDDGEAVQWYRKAAEQGLAEAQVRLGAMYATGKGVPQDNKEAEQWNRKAATQDNANAQYYLGAMYATGRGVPQDDKEAAQWFRKAAEQGHSSAQWWLNEYGKLLHSRVVNG